MGGGHAQFSQFRDYIITDSMVRYSPPEKSVQVMGDLSSHFNDDKSYWNHRPVK